MKKMKVYLAKSNRANPDVVARVRQTLSNYNLEIVEFKGGNYSHKDMLKCDSLVVIPESMNSDEVSIGKGLYEQITTFAREKSSYFEDIIVITSEDSGTRVIESLEIYDHDNYVNHAFVSFEEDTYENLDIVLDDIVGDFYYGSGESKYALKSASENKRTSNSNYYLLIGRQI